MPAVHRRIREVLDRVDRLPVPPDEHAEIGTVTRQRDRLVVLVRRDVRVHADAVDDALHELARLRREVALIVWHHGRSLFGDRAGGDRGDHAGRREAHSQETTLTLGHDLEANSGLVQPGLLPLELPQRRPLGLADRLSGRLDLELHQRRAFFLRFTRRGWLVTAGAGTVASGISEPSLDGPFGGVREERFGPPPPPPPGGPTFGISRRVINPWPTVQRLVVIQ